MFEPIRLLHLELDRPLPDVAPTTSAEGQVYRRARAFVRLHGHPLGSIDFELPGGRLAARDLADRVWAGFGPDIRARLREHGQQEVAGLTPSGLPSLGELPSLGVAPFVDVVIATRDRPESLARCLDSLFRMDYPSFQVIVVDSAPSSDATAVLVRERYAGPRGVRYLRARRPGLAIAHNTALPSVTAPIVAFTDDDVVVDRLWLRALVEAFSAADDAGCVTGMILPSELETQAQVWLEDAWSLGKGSARRLFNVREHRPKSALFPYTAGVFGSGANMAFKTSVLRDIGGFDGALGAGTLAKGGDDLAAFFAVVKKGYTLVYEPAAMVHHSYRREYQALWRQSFGYGAGLSAYLTSAVLERPWLAFDFALRLPFAVARLLCQRSGAARPSQAPYPRSLKLRELMGTAYGPIGYLRSRWRTRGYRRQVRPGQGPGREPTLTERLDERARR